MSNSNFIGPFQSKVNMFDDFFSGKIGKTQPRLSIRQSTISFTVDEKNPPRALGKGMVSVVVDGYEDDHLAEEVIPQPQPQQIVQHREGFFARISAYLGIRSFNQAHRHLIGIAITPANLTSVRTCRALERFVIKTVERGPLRQNLLQRLEAVRRASSRGQMNQAFLILNSVFADINQTPKVAEDAPPQGASRWALRKFARQHARIDRKEAILTRFAGPVRGLVTGSLVEQLRNLKVEGQYQEGGCITNEAIDLYREVNKLINGDITRVGSQANLIENALFAAKNEQNIYFKSEQVGNQLATLATQADRLGHGLVDELNQISVATRGY